MNPITSHLSSSEPKEGVDQYCNDAPSRVAVPGQGGSHVRRVFSAEAGSLLENSVATADSGFTCSRCGYNYCGCWR